MNSKQKKIASLVSIAAMMLLSAGAVTADTNTAPWAVAPYEDQTQTTVMPTRGDLTWLGYDNDDPFQGVGLTSGGTFEGAIRLTPTELAPYSGWNCTVVSFYHYDDAQFSGTVKIYGMGTAAQPGALTTSQAIEVTGVGWFNISLSSPVTIAAHDIWVSIEAPHTTGQHPLMQDSATAVDGKGDFVYLNSAWSEMQTFGAQYDHNWCIRAGVSSGTVTDVTPPVTTCTLDGNLQGGVYVSDVTVTLNATDDMSGVNYTMVKVDSGAFEEYSAPFVVSDDGDHTIAFYSVDLAGNQEDEQTVEFTIEHPQPPEDIIISIQGGLGVSVVVKNNGTEDLTNVSYSILLDGGIILLGKAKTGTIDALGAGEEVTITNFVLGLGKTTISVVAGDAEATANGTVFLFFVLGVE